METQSKKLSEVLFFQEGPGVRKTQFTISGVKLLNGGNINNNKLDLSTTKNYISEEEAFGKYKHFLVNEGDLIIASSGIVVSKFDGKITFVEKEHLPLCMNTSTIRFRSLSDELNIKYFYFFLKSNSFKNQIQRLITGSAQLNFGPSHLQKVNITFPSLSNQHRIVKVLSQCEALIQKRKESIELLDELLRSTFLEMFGSSDEISKSNFETLGNNISYLTSGSRGWAKYYTENGAKFLRIQNVGNGIIRTDNLIYVNPPESAESERTRVQPGDLIISITADLGRTSVIPENIGEAYISQHLALIRLNKSINPVYAAYFYNMPFGNNAIQRKNRSAVKAGLNFNDIKSLPIVIPDLTLQNKFSQIVGKVEGVKQGYAQSLLELENLYGSISQQAFNGELDLSKIDISDMEYSKKKDLEEMESDLTEEQFEDLPESFEHTLPTGEVSSNRETDIRNMSIRQYLGFQEYDEETEGLEFHHTDKDFFYQFILTKGFAERTFTLHEVERYARKYILRGTGFEFTYDNWKTILFRFIGAKQPLIEQVFDEKDLSIKLKLTDEAFKV